MQKQLTFKHDFSDERTEKYKKFKTSPYANDEVDKLVDACLTYTNVGKDNVPDLLTLSYYAGNYVICPEKPQSMLWKFRTCMLFGYTIGHLLDL